jgi:hypothetical protein
MMGMQREVVEKEAQSPSIQQQLWQWREQQTSGQLHMSCLRSVVAGQGD